MTGKPPKPLMILKPNGATNGPSTTRPSWRLDGMGRMIIGVQLLLHRPAVRKIIDTTNAYIESFNRVIRKTTKNAVAAFQPMPPPPS